MGEFRMTGKRQRVGLFPNLMTYRTELGLSVPELAAMLGNRPSGKSIGRLESGHPIRIESVNKVFNEVNKLKLGTLVRGHEVRQLQASQK
jgi:ribosome-binding protein aMBF1 (putative translation factor)